MNFEKWRSIQKSVELFQCISEENLNHNYRDIIQSFLPFVQKELGFKKLPKIHFVCDIEFARKYKTFGSFLNHTIIVYVKDRHIMDVLRTLAHELVHHCQKVNGCEMDGNTGSPTENEANAIAGILLRKFAENNSHLFTLPSIDKI